MSTTHRKGNSLRFPVQDVYEVDGKKVDIFSYSVPDTFKTEAKSDVMEFMVENGLEPTKENLGKAIEYVQERFVRENFLNIMLAYGKDVETKITEKKDKDVHNPDLPTDKTKPPEEAEKEEKEFHEFLKKGVSMPQAGQPLFGKK